MKRRATFNPDVLNAYSRSLGENSPDIHRTIPLEIQMKNHPGVYVYSYSHYLKHPVNIETGQTYFKVGMSNISPEKRVKGQNKTSFPEAPILLRIFYRSKENARLLESEFHQVLRQTGSKVPGRGKNKGREWFLTTLPALDLISEKLQAESIEFHPSTPVLEPLKSLEYKNRVAGVLDILDFSNEDVSDSIYFNPLRYINRDH